MKTITVAFVLLISTSLMAQDKKSRVCIKINENKNGETTLVDTCFESADHAEIEAFIQRMGMDGHVKMLHEGDAGPGNGEKIVIRHQEIIKGDGEAQEFNIEIPEGELRQHALEDHMIIRMDENGKIIHHEGEPHIIIRQLEGDGEQLEMEIHELMKNAEMDLKNGEPGTKKEIRVLMISRTVEINSLTSEDKKSLPESIRTRKGKSFESLNISPNPAKDVVNISYKSNSPEPLKLRLYDAAGQLILEEESISPDKEMNKRLDLSPLQKGIYFLHLEQGKKTEVKKIVVSE
ncbi:MAG: hypothetical protein K0R65_1675 [Crocinitomicaceae bacterium]|jgi:hypothetical protein|nr:hypothetical protein [Crocinitomicaceae bacterium]